MDTSTQVKTNRNLERLFLLLCSVVMGLLFYQLNTTLQRDMKEVPKRLGDGTIVNLNTPNPSQQVSKLLQKGFYFEDPRDIKVVSNIIGARLQADIAPLDNIGALNKRRFYVDASEAFAQGGATFQKRVHLSRQLLGFTGPDSLLFAQEQSNPRQLSEKTNIGLGDKSISAKVQNDGGDAVAGVMVRLQLILPQDSLYSNSVVEVSRLQKEAGKGIEKTFVLDSAGARQLQSLTAYGRTNGEGQVQFSGLPEGRAFSLIPLQPGYEFGLRQGIASLNRDKEFSFTQKKHSIKLLSTRDFNNLKKEGAFIVRTPDEVNKWFWIIALVYFGAFWILHLLLSTRFKNADQLFVPVVFLLTGFSFLALLSLQDPLRDRFLARDMLQYFGIGFVLICILLLFDLRRFTPDAGLYRLFYWKKDSKAANGWPWAMAGIGLLILTIILGSGPEGSGVKVNLFGFQPSELVRYLLLLFLAGYFTANEVFISGYATAKKRWNFFGFSLLAVGLIMLLFLMLGDLGPAMVVCFTFILLLSFARGDFILVAGAIVLYTLAVWITKNIWLATLVTALVAGGYFYLIRKQISEPAIMAIVVMAAFLLLDQIPFLDAIFPGPIQRLSDRKAIWQNAWDNNVFGGDQVANGIWAMASGGIQGQGIGEGFGKTIPEAHTDMILPAFGEEFGWAGIIGVFVLYLIYLHRAIVVGRHTGRPFLFYLSAGIGISTFVQFVLIAGGSTGALPLSGVALPFVSYGGSSLIINMVAAGFLLSSSMVQGSQAQMKYIGKMQDRNLLPALVAACVGIVLLGINVSRYLFNNERWVVEPALVAERSGARMFSYNPRIAILINRLEAGNLFDRKGRLLATSKGGMVAQQKDSLVAVGLASHELEALSHRRQDRYYPFGAHMFFWTGDANTGVFSGGNNGYFAEYQHGAELRGFSTPAAGLQVMATRYQEDPFLPRTEREMFVAKKNYRALSPMLLSGINSPMVDSFKKQNRDVQLTMDGALQTAIQQSLQQNEAIKNSRVSVVIMNDVQGDVLASALYPLPPVLDWELLNLSAREQANLGQLVTTSDLGFTHATQPGSTAKLLTALAAFNKLGMAAAQKSFLIRQEDLVRVKGDEPDETGTINISRAIVKSNNPYFIRLANESGLEEEMVSLYIQTGMFLKGLGGYYYNYNKGNAYQSEQWRQTWRNSEFKSKNRYDKNNIRATRGLGISGMAWGQGELVSTPASVARLAAGIANNGYLSDNRYVLRIADSLLSPNDSIQIGKQPGYTGELTSYMKAQSANKIDKLGIKVAGKTGTPERIIKGKRINDGWYVFFAPSQDGKGHIVVCVRIEDTRGSSMAVQIAGSDVIPHLTRLGYISGFEQ